MLAMNMAELDRFMREVFPQVSADFQIETVTDESLTVRLMSAEHHLRPGGTISGPSMFALADVAFYLALLSRIGPVALAVTTNCNIDFMRKPEANRDLLAQTRILKLGKSLAVGDVLIRSAGQSAVVARASLTYAIPPNATKA